MQYFQELSDRDLETVVGGSGPVTFTNAGFIPNGDPSTGSAVLVTADASGGQYANVAYGGTQGITINNGLASVSAATGISFAFSF